MSPEDALAALETTLRLALEDGAVSEQTTIGRSHREITARHAPRVHISRSCARAVVRHHPLKIGRSPCTLRVHLAAPCTLRVHLAAPCTLCVHLAAPCTLCVHLAAPWSRSRCSHCSPCRRAGRIPTARRRLRPRPSMYPPRRRTRDQPTPSPSKRRQRGPLPLTTVARDPGWRGIRRSCGGVRWSPRRRCRCSCRRRRPRIGRRHQHRHRPELSVLEPDHRVRHDGRHPGDDGLPGWRPAGRLRRYRRRRDECARAQPLSRSAGWRGSRRVSERVSPVARRAMPLRWTP